MNRTTIVSYSSPVRLGTARAQVRAMQGVKQNPRSKSVLSPAPSDIKLLDEFNRTTSSQPSVNTSQNLFGSNYYNTNNQIQTEKQGQ